MPAQEADILLALRGERGVQAGLGATALSVRGLRSALVEANAEMDVTRRRSFLMNQALFTARRLLYAGTLTLIGFTAAVGLMGFKFNMTMENNTVALTQFLGSTAAAQQELSKLYEIAAKTPFEFPDLVEATRKFLAFGFSLQETNRFMGIIGDTVAAFGGGREEIQRMVLVFGQMKAAGRVLGQDLLQLNQLGIPALQILREQLGLTQDQMANIGRLHIPANIAIEALMRGLTQRFEGASEKQAKTLQGRLSTLHDYAARLFGTLTLPLYNRLRDYALPKLTDLTLEMQKAAQAGGIRGALHVIDTRYGTNIARTFDAMAIAATNFWTIIKNDVIPTVLFLNRTFQPLRILLVLIGGVLGFFAAHSTLTKIVLAALILEFLRFRMVLLLFGGAGGHGGLVGMVVRGIGLGATPPANSLIGRWNAWKNLIILTRLTTVSAFRNILGSWQVLTRGYIRGANGQFTALTRLQKGVLALRNAFLGLGAAEGLATAPISLLVAAFILLTIGLVILYFKWKRFHDLVNRTAKFLYSHWYILALIPMVGPFAAAAVLMHRHLQTLIHLFKTLVGWIRTAVRWLGRIHMPNLLHMPHFPHIGLPGLAEGGSVTVGGAFMVGERGPEVAMLPAGSAVSPVSATNFPIEPMAGGGGNQLFKFQILLDGKELTKSHVRKINDAKARS
jgi:tape measure domain-containing protein